MLEEPSKTQGLYAAIDELQAENERLRDALNKIHERDPYASLAGVIAWQIAGRALASDITALPPNEENR